MQKNNIPNKFNFYTFDAGEIPKEINNLQLEILDVYNNSFKSPVPLFLFNISSLSMIDLARNEFYGSLPDNICQGLDVIQELYFDRNRLSGPIPSKLWQCKELRTLSLSDNDLSGVVPRNVGNLTKLMMLYLDGNKFTGTNSLIQPFIYSALSIMNFRSML